MRASTFFATLSAAVAVSAQGAGADDWEWSVTDWEAGCARSGCFTSFNIKADQLERGEEHKLPAFNAACSFEEGAAEKACELTITPSTTMEVRGQLIAAAEGADGPTVQVSVQFGSYEQAGTVYTYTAKGEAKYNQFVAPPMEFTIVPHEATGVA